MNGSSWHARLSITILVGALAVAGCSGPSDPPPPENRSPADSPAPPPGGLVAGLAWDELAAAPSQRTEVVAAVAGSRIYVVGGYRADGSTVATVEVLDAVTGQWRPGPQLPVAVNHAMAASVDDTVYVFGGYLGRPGGEISAAAFRLDGGRWREVAPLPQGRAAGTAVAVGGSVYLAGGVGPDGLADRMLVYDAAGDGWSAGPGPPTPREHLGGAGFDGLVYTVGGRTGDGNLPALEAYDPGSGEWTVLPDLPTARGGLAAAAICSGWIVAVGGERLDNPLTYDQAEAYEVAAGAWSALPAMPTARHGLGVATVGAAVYALAGGPQAGLHVSGAAEAIDLAALGPCS